MQNKVVALLRASIMAFSLVIALTDSSPAQSQGPGLFDDQGDIGPVLKPGKAIYDTKKQEYTITGSGTNMWGGNDEFHFAWKRLKGDFILTANVRFIGKGVDPHRKIGWIIRPSLEADVAPFEPEALANAQSAVRADGRDGSERVAHLRHLHALHPGHAAHGGCQE